MQDAKSLHHMKETNEQKSQLLNATANSEKSLSSLSI